MKKILIAGFAASAMLLSAPAVFAGALDNLGATNSTSNTRGSGNTVNTDAAGIDVAARGGSIRNLTAKNTGTTSATSNTSGSGNKVKTTAAGISVTTSRGGSIRNLKVKNSGTTTARSNTRGSGNKVSTSAAGVRVHAGR